MKTKHPIICLTVLLFTLAASAGEDFKFPIYSRGSRYGYTNTWYVSMSRLKKLPKWNEQGEPPLSVGKAISLGKAWVVSKGFSPDCYVGGVEFCSVNRGAPPIPPDNPNKPSELRPYWFYTIHFEEVMMIGSWTTCVVLSDGSIVEPETIPQTTNIVRYLDAPVN